MEQHYRKPAIESPILRVLLVILGVILIIGFEFFISFPTYANIFKNLDIDSPVLLILSRGTTFLLTLLFLWIFAKKVDRRPLLKNWFSMKERKYDLLTSFLIGGGLITIGSFILGRFGLIEFSPGNISMDIWLNYAFLFFVAALWEEIVFRGYIQQNLMQGMPPVLALVITAVLFMLLHGTNPNIDVLPRVNIFLAGILLGASCLYTKNLWFAQGLHWGWNLFQGPVFGYEVSGIGTPALFQQEIIEDSSWTGGAFGFEGSILATIIIVIATAIIILSFKKITKHAST